MNKVWVIVVDPSENLLEMSRPSQESTPGRHWRDVVTVLGIEDRRKIESRGQARNWRKSTTASVENQGWARNWIKLTIVSIESWAEPGIETELGSRPHPNCTQAHCLHSSCGVNRGHLIRSWVQFPVWPLPLLLFTWSHSSGLQLKLADTKLHLIFRPSNFLIILPLFWLNLLETWM